MTDVISTTAINRVYPEGMKTIAFCLELQEKAEKWKAENYTFEVWDHSYEPEVPAIKRGITNISYTNENRIFLEMNRNETAAYAIGNFKMDGSFDPFGPGDLGFPNPEREKKKQEAGKHDPVKGPGKDFGYMGPKPFRIEIYVKKEEKIVQTLECSGWICEELDCFQLKELNGQKYLLYVPEQLEAGKEYPLVLFIADAGARGTYDQGPLVQGTGAMVWTEPAEQYRHPCFVISPVYGPKDILTHDNFTFDSKIYAMKDVIDDLKKEYPIDGDQIFLTGQSMGCMSACQLMIRYPDYFAGAMLVAGQWEPVKTAEALKNKRVWILVSENDRKAYPGMNAVLNELKNQGGDYEVIFLDAKLPENEIETQMRREAAGNSNIKYTVFAGDSVVPDGMAAGPGSNHTCTWRVAYSIEAVRDWLLTENRG